MNAAVSLEQSVNRAHAAYETIGRPGAGSGAPKRHGATQ
jgi:hypothetical protein